MAEAFFRNAAARNAAALGAGALLAVAASLAGTAIRGDGPRGLPPAGRPAWWVVDRDADAVYALDDRLILALRSSVRRPIDVRSTIDGGAWILRSSAARGAESLARLLPDGTIALEVPLWNRATMASSDAGDALVIEGKGSPSSRLLRITPDGGTSVLAEEPGLTCAIADGSSLVLGSSSGALRRSPLAPEPGGEACANLDGPIAALARSGPGSEIYVLFGETGERLGLLGEDLKTRWIARSGMRCSGIAPTPDARHVWVVDVERPCIRRFSREGSLELERTDPVFLEAGRAVATESGGLLVATPGALICVDANGRTRPGQGGFVFLSGADRIGGD